MESIAELSPGRAVGQVGIGPSLRPPLPPYRAMSVPITCPSLQAPRATTGLGQGHGGEGGYGTQVARVGVMF